MLRWMMSLLVAISAVGTAAAESAPATKSPEAPPTTKSPEDPTTTKTPEAPTATKSPEAPAATKRAGRPAPTRSAAVRAASNLPPGLPRPYYKYRTTVAPATPPPLYERRGRQLVVVEEEYTDVLFTPVGVMPYVPLVNGTPLLPGSATLPGYYGTTHSYSYDGPYYGGPQMPYWARLPYACGVYGYC